MHLLLAAAQPETPCHAAQWKRLRGGAWLLLIASMAAGVACTAATLVAVHEEAAVVQLAQQLAASSVQVWPGTMLLNPLDCTPLFCLDSWPVGHRAHAGSTHNTADGTPVLLSCCRASGKSGSENPHPHAELLYKLSDTLLLAGGGCIAQA